MQECYDIIVVGAGHAGCEAAMAASKMGSSVLLITMDMGKIAQMSCNPSIGGIAKGQIVREIDALGGYSGIVTDSSTIQFRMLNRSKGPAMWSPRAQCDRMYYSQHWRHILENACNLDIWADTAVDFGFSESNISYVLTSTGVKFHAKSFIITAGTFLNGKIFVGQASCEGGRISEPSSNTLTRVLAERGVTTSRMKTGTPPRIDVRSVDLSKLIPQYGDEDPAKFSFLNYKSPIQAGVPQKLCYIAHTSTDVHDILKSAFHLSPLFSGKIVGIGPRYCPSIEDKLRTFADKDSHQLFLEPEGWNTNEYYLQGFSSSLPFDVQYKALKLVPGFENVHVYRPAYAIEYDYFDPTQLRSTLQSKVIPNLFFAGQVNGTTGYEEAAAQGLYAGINAHNYVHDKEEFILSRDSSYIGVLVDDLVTKGVDEPYRMFTSRAEYRILLRQDNADFRLTEKSYKIGLADEYRYSLCQRKYNAFNALSNELGAVKPPFSEINQLLQEKGTSPLDANKPLSALLLRPQLRLSDLYKFVPRGTKSTFTKQCKVPFNPEIVSDVDIYLGLPHISFIKDILHRDSISEEVLDSVEIYVKYAGYIDRELQLAQKIKNLENLSIPEDFDYSKVTSLSMESRLKLTKHRPRNIAQASRIPGVSPADISVLLVYFGR